MAQHWIDLSYNYHNNYLNVFKRKIALTDFIGFNLWEIYNWPTSLMCHRTHSMCLCLDLLVLFKCFHPSLLPEWRPAAQQLQDGQWALQDHRTHAAQRHQQHPALLRQRREDGRPATEPRAAVREPAGGLRPHRHEGCRVQWGRNKMHGPLK